MTTSKPFLIADDSPHKRAFLLEIVKHAHWDGMVLQAVNTDEAMLQIERTPEIAAAFIDYEMPTKNGPAVIAALKKANPAARIALVTAADVARFREEATAAGAEACICTVDPEIDVTKALGDLLAEWKKALKD